MRPLTEQLRDEWASHLPAGWQVLLNVGDIPADVAAHIPHMSPRSDFAHSVLPPGAAVFPTAAARACLVLYPRCREALDAVCFAEAQTLDHDARNALAREGVWFVLLRFANQGLAETLAEYNLALWSAAVSRGIDDDLLLYYREALAAARGPQLDVTKAG